MRVKHFVLNLYRRPLRLGIFLAAFKGMGFPLSDLMICSAVDALQFDNWKALCNFANLWGFDWKGVWEQSVTDQRNHKGIRKAEGALRLGIDILLRYISEEPEGWYILWADDYVPGVVYTDFIDLYKQLGTHTETQVIAEVSLEPGEAGYESKKEMRNQKHSYLDLHRGISGMESDTVLAVTPKGAKHILEMSKLHVGISYELFFLEYLLTTNRHIWTCLDLRVNNLWDIVGGDIWADGSEDRSGWNVARKALYNGEIIPIHRQDMKMITECETEWDLMQAKSKAGENICR